MIDHCLSDAFGVLSCQFWSTVLQCGARLPIHTLNYWAVRGARFLTDGVFECDIAHRRSVAVLCMLYKIRCNPMHPLNDALPGPYVPEWVTSDALVTHRCTLAPPRCRTSQYRRTFLPPSVSLSNDLDDPIFDGVGLAGFKSRVNAFLLYPEWLHRQFGCLACCGCLFGSRSGCTDLSMHEALRGYFP